MVRLGLPIRGLLEIDSWVAGPWRPKHMMAAISPRLAKINLSDTYCRGEPDAARVVPHLGKHARVSIGHMAFAAMVSILILL